MEISSKTWKVEEIFQDIPDDPDNVRMIIPDEIASYLDLHEGDSIRIQITETGMIFSKA